LNSFLSPESGRAEADLSGVTRENTSLKESLFSPLDEEVTFVLSFDRSDIISIGNDSITLSPFLSRLQVYSNLEAFSVPPGKFKII
jgi:hypothetical protein